MEMNKLLKHVRYRISYGQNSISFGAPMANNDKELADILEDLIAGLRADSKKVIGECNKCNAFILEDEEHVC